MLSVRILQLRLSTATMLAVSATLLTASATALAAAAQDAPPKPDGAEVDRKQDDPRQEGSRQGERGGRRGGRGLPQAPDWPRAGGFGPSGISGTNAERPMIEGLVLEGLIPSAFGKRELNDADVQRVLEVAKEISPEWGAAIEGRIKADAEQVKATLRTSGRRLLGMAALKERAPKVYAVKVAELRAQAECERLASEMREAIKHAIDDPSTNPEAVKALKAELGAAAQRQVDATIAARREELAALEDRMKKLQSDLDADMVRREALAEELTQRLQNRRESQRAPSKPDAKPDTKPDARPAPRE